MEQIREFIRKETVFVIAAVLTFASMFLVPPDSSYLGYINFSVLAILFCLMAVIAGFQKIGVFEALSLIILSKTNNEKTIGLILVLTCFFSSMFITNDVALITFVPFTIGMLGQDDDDLIFVIVMETIAANLGSIMTPVGNPQNLFLFSYYSMNIVDFFKIVAPIGIISFGMIITVMLFRKSSNLAIDRVKKNTYINNVKLIKYIVMFVMCILTVLHIVNYIACFVVIVIALLFSDRKLFYEIDYMLLLTFVCFFIFVGNMSNLEEIRMFIAGVLKNREVLVSAIISQGISNVPAAIMLAPFTDMAARLIIGVNIGGLGTIIASMASLISYKYYAVGKNSRKGRYIAVFSLHNFALLALLLLGVSVLKL